MRKSELLDSLDLEMKPVLKKKNNNKKSDHIEEAIGYESEEELWNYTMKRDIK